MAVNFSIRDFGYPWSIWKLRRLFERTQWLSEYELQSIQDILLRRVIRHAYETVPYYQQMFRRLRMTPDDVRSASDLQYLPTLSKDIVRREFRSLCSTARKSYYPREARTSGTNGQPLTFLLDKPANILEFVYYWRHWSWAGYRLGTVFSEFSASNFLGHPQRRGKSHVFEPITRRLLLNSMTLSEEAVAEQIALIRRYRPQYIKGLASVLSSFAVFVRASNTRDMEFRAVFSTGETLLPAHRRDLERTFRCKVFDSYGHMERTVAISECPAGGMHINPEYGVLEFCQPAADMGSRTVKLARVVGTSLHNFSMPLIRYEVGDLVEPWTGDQPCACNRQMPRVRRIIGREQDVITLPDGRVLTTLFIVFESVPGIAAGQIVQQEPLRLCLRIARTAEYTHESEASLLARVREFVGDSVRLDVSYETFEALCRTTTGAKFRAIVSHVNPHNILPQPGESTSE